MLLRSHVVGFDAPPSLDAVNLPPFGVYIVQVQ
jgi:hypothetical protein